MDAQDTSNTPTAASDNNPTSTQNPPSTPPQTPQTGSPQSTPGRERRKPTKLKPKTPEAKTEPSMSNVKTEDRTDQETQQDTPEANGTAGKELAPTRTQRRTAGDLKPLKDRPPMEKPKENNKDDKGSLSIHVHLDLEVELELHARIVGDIDLSLL